MSRPTVALSLLLAAVLVTPTWASFGGGSSKPEPPPQPAVPGGSSTSSGVSTPRMQAEQTYALAYEEVAKAKKDVADGKAKNAEKKFKRALERGENAVALAPEYHEAWNLVGYCARKLGQFDKAVASYEKCLAIEPAYAPAREYLGETWLERGDAKKAREQLTALERLNAAAEAKELQTAIAAWEAKNPAAATAASSDSSATPVAAPADSAKGGN